MDGYVHVDSNFVNQKFKPCIQIGHSIERLKSYVKRLINWST